MYPDSIINLIGIFRRCLIVNLGGVNIISYYVWKSMINLNLKNKPLRCVIKSTQPTVKSLNSWNSISPEREKRVVLYRGVITTIHITTLCAFNNKIQYFNSSYSCYYFIKGVYQMVILVCLKLPDALNASVLLEQVFIRCSIISQLPRRARLHLPTHLLID
jgi:hypothetical protein